MTTTPTVLFVCIHNAGRSQMAAGYTRPLSGGAVQVQLMTTEQVRESDVVITMGCGDVCPIRDDIKARV